MLKILLVSEPGVDGVFRHVEGLTHFLIGKGHEVHFAFSDRRGSAGLHDLVNCVRERGGHALNLGVSNGPEPRDLAALLKLRAFARSVRPNVIHAHSSKAGALARLLPILGIQARYFYTPHAYYGLDERPGLRRAFFNLVERVLGRIGTTINISQDEANFARTSLWIRSSRQQIIHNPVSNVFFTVTTPEMKAAARKELNLPQHAIVVGTVGRLAEQKDPATLYKAFARLVMGSPEIFLVHLGEGPLKQQILRLIDSLGIGHRVRLLEYRDRPITIYQTMDLLVMSSRYEAGWPISILEAMAQNLPIVTTDCPGCHDIGTGRLTHCWTAPVGDAECLADALRAALADRTTLRPCNHRDIARTFFAVEQCYGAILQAYGSAT